MMGVSTVEIKDWKGDRHLKEKGHKLRLLQCNEAKNGELSASEIMYLLADRRLFTGTQHNFYRFNTLILG